MQAQARISSIQALRAVAAVMVVFFHVNDIVVVSRTQYSMVPPLLFTFEPLQKIGTFGVDIFFIISGFVMIYITQNGPRGVNAIKPFIQRRLERIVPTYWFYTLFMCLLLFKAKQPLYDGMDLLHSLFFIPYEPHMNWPAPILAVGWTLSYEIYFYILIALGMLLTQRGFVITLGLFFLTCAMSVFWFTPSWFIMRWMTQSIILEFFFGMLVCLAYLKYGGINKLLGWLVLFMAIGMLTVCAHFEWSLDWRGVVWGIPAAGIVLWFLSRESSVGFFSGRVWQALGASSYALYLSHLPVLVLIQRALRSSGLFFIIPSDILVIVMGLLAIIVGHMLYLVIEKPMNRFIGRLIGRRMKLA